MATKVRGAFTQFEGSGHFDVDEPTNSHLEITIMAASVDTGDPLRDEELRGADLLDVAAHPTIHFVSLVVARRSAAHYRVLGDLTIRGVTNAVTVDLRFPGGSIDSCGLPRIGLEGSALIRRRDWGVAGSSMLDRLGLLIGTRVAIEFGVSAIQQHSQPHELQGA
jgi:polyisoprenoid-binding protein YceI